MTDDLDEGLPRFLARASPTPAAPIAPPANVTRTEGDTMQRWTVDDLHRFAPEPRARGEQKDSTHHLDRLDIYAGYVGALLDSWDAIMTAGIDTPLRLAHFMTIIGHETGGFTIGDEHCTWSYDRMCQLWPDRFQSASVTMRMRYAACLGSEEKLAELAYGGWARLGQRLGNTEAGDGWEFRGRGPFQDTGRDTYRELGQAIGVDLLGDPDQLDDPHVGIKAAIWKWQKLGLSRYADRNYLRAVQNAINRGNAFSGKDPNNWPDRQQWFTRAWAVFGGGQPLPLPTDIGLGAYGPEVTALQTRLKELGYACGSLDGVFGPECRRAVAAFKADWKAHGGGDLEPDEAVGPATKAALAAAQPIARVERSQATMADLLAGGSTEMQAGQTIKAAGKLAVSLGGLGGASQLVGDGGAGSHVNPADALNQTVGWVPAAKATLIPVIEAVQWALHNWWWVAIICVGVWVYSKGLGVQVARLAAHRLGLNLGR